jgi:hypothetical protein
MTVKNIVILMFGLMACEGLARAQDWVSKTSVNPMTGKTETSSIALAADWSGSEVTTPQLVANTSGGGKGCELYLEQPFTLLSIGFKAKFDGKIRRNPFAPISKDGTAVFLDHSWKELRGAKELVVEFHPESGSNQAVTFKVAGLPGAFDACK